METLTDTILILKDTLDRYPFPSLKRHKDLHLEDLFYCLSLLENIYICTYKEPSDKNSMLIRQWTYKRESTDRKRLIDCINFALQNPLSQQQLANLIQFTTFYIQQILAKTTDDIKYK